MSTHPAYRPIPVWTATLTILTSWAASNVVWAEEATIDGEASAGEKRKLPDGTVRFELGSSQITLESARRLDRIAEFLQDQPDGEVLVVGHTDSQGTQEANLTLSRQRAERVKDELVRRRVDPTRIKVMGVGESERISTEETQEAQALNRRVEVWVGTRDAIAVVSWIYRTVQAQKPAVSKWDPAYLQMELRRLFRVRTLKQSAGEVTFVEGHRLYLGPEAFMVVYGRDDRRRRGKSRVADVTLDEGTLLASLVAKDRRTLSVETDAARMRLSRTEKTRIASSKAKAQSTVSVYSGLADVYAQRQRVRVSSGYGTRVKNGRPPETPERLPPAPEWTTFGPTTIFTGIPSTNLRWQSRTSTTKAILEIGAENDADLTRPLRTFSVARESAPNLAVEPGRYWLRVTSVSERDVVGHPSEPRALHVLPAPEALEGPSLEPDGGMLIMSQPGIVRLPAPDGMRTEWQLDGAAVQMEAYLSPGEHTLSCMMTDPAGRAMEGLLLVRVERLVLNLDEVGTPFIDEIDSVTPLTLSVTDHRGQPIDSLDLVAASPNSRTSLEDFDEPGPGPMLSIEAPIKAFAQAKAGSKGTYTLRYRDFAPPTRRQAPVVVFDRRSRTGRLLEIPLAGIQERPRAETAPAARKSAAPPLIIGFYAGAMGGVMRGAGGDFGPSVRGELGFVLTQGMLRLTLGADGGWTSLTTRNDVGSLTLFPINGKATFGLRLGSYRPYLGLAGGARLQDFSRDPGIDERVTVDEVSENLVGIGGLGYHFDGLEPFVEFRYGKMDIPASGVTQVANGPTFYLGLRYFFTDG